MTIDISRVSKVTFPYILASILLSTVTVQAVLSAQTGTNAAHAASSEKVVIPNVTKSLHVAVRVTASPVLPAAQTGTNTVYRVAQTGTDSVGRVDPTLGKAAAGIAPTGKSYLRSDAQTGTNAIKVAAQTGSNGVHVSAQTGTNSAFFSASGANRLSKAVGPKSLECTSSSIIDDAAC